MTQTLQEALLKAGIVTKEKLARAEADKKAAERQQRQKKFDRPAPPQRPQQPPPKKDLPPNKSKRGSVSSDSLRDTDRSVRSGPEIQMRGPGRERYHSPGFIEGKHHHHSRTDCEACGRPSPDVEYYEHKNKSLDKYWLCVRCADDNNVHDDFRQTMQSPQAMKGLFQRGYGPTKIFKKR